MALLTDSFIVAVSNILFNNIVAESENGIVIYAPPGTVSPSWPLLAV